VQAVVSAHPPAPSSSRPPFYWPVARHVRLRNPIKSTLAHDAVAAVVLHKHHLIVRVGAGLIQFVYGSHSRLAADLSPSTKIYFRCHFRGVSFICLEIRIRTTLSFLLDDRDQLLFWSNHRSRKKIQLLLAIVRPLCGSMHVVALCGSNFCFTKAFFPE